MVGHHSDVGCVQVGTDLEAYVESEARTAPVVRPQALENANKISRPTMAQV